MALPIVAPFLASCSALHVHTFTSPYETDETSHWKTCSICHEKFDQHTHVFNEIDNKCFICDYIDPLVYVDENNQMTGLTPYGKTKYTVNLPSNVQSIGSKAFKDSNAVTVKLNKELNYYCIDSFSESHVKTIDTEESMVKWKEPDSLGRIYKERVFDENVAKIGNQYYSTLQEAFKAVENEETTITLLRDRYDLLMNEPIEIDHTIILEPLYENTLLSCDFDIADNGILYVPETIVYEGNARLLLTVVKEVRGNGYSYKEFDNQYEDVYSSGSIVFVNKDECPLGANVTYVKSFREIGHSSGYPAIGARQVANELLLIPHKHYAFGTVRFSQDFATIKGLTKYGLTVTDLTLTSPIKGKKAVIGQNAFAVGWKVKVSLPVIDDLNYYMFRTKGFFTHLTIGEGITKISKWAFTNRIDSSLPGIDVIKQLPIVLSHLTSVKLGDEVEEIGYESFYDNVSLTEVIGGANLNFIDKRAFGGVIGGISLTTADFSRCYKLNSIPCNTFSGCSKLSYLALPPGLWKSSWGAIATFAVYFPYDMTPEKIAYSFANRDRDSEDSWQKTSLKTDPIYYTKTNRKDSLGKFNDVGFTVGISAAIEKCCDNGEIYISDGYTGTTRTIDLKGHTKAMTINVAPNFTDFTIKNNGSSDLTVKQGEYLMLNNVKVEGNVTLKTNDENYPTYISNTAGFAIRGVDSTDIPQVNLTGLNGKVNIENISSTEANIHNETYDAYGIFNFTIKDDDDGEGAYTNITDTSPFGDEATSITYAHQTEDAIRVKVNNGTTKNNNVTHITFSSDVESIAANAFYDFNNIQQVTCEEGLTSIGESAFDGCDGLTSVTLPNSLTSLGKKAFLDCDLLTTVNIPTSLTSISEACFQNCPRLKEIDIPNNIETIEKEAFAKCTSLTSVEFPINLKTIGESAFKGCSALNKIVIPNDSHLTTIGANAFSGCNSLIIASFGENITTNWTVNTEPGPTPVPEAELADSANAALHLRYTYVEQEWTRSA